MIINNIMYKIFVISGFYGRGDIVFVLMVVNWNNGKDEFAFSLMKITCMSVL